MLGKELESRSSGYNMDEIAAILATGIILTASFCYFYSHKLMARM